MARFGDDKIEEVRLRSDIVEIIGAHVRLKRAGRNFVGLCPFHQEKTPSFSVNAERGFFHCFGCNAGGTVFNFIMKMDGLAFPEAVRSLAQRYGMICPRQFRRRAVDFRTRVHVLGESDRRRVLCARALENARRRATARVFEVAWHQQRDRGAFRIGFAPARATSLTKALESAGCARPASESD